MALMLVVAMNVALLMSQVEDVAGPSTSGDNDDNGKAGTSGVNKGRRAKKARAEDEWEQVSLVRAIIQCGKPGRLGMIT